MYPIDQMSESFEQSFLFDLRSKISDLVDISKYFYKNASLKKKHYLKLITRSP